MKTIFAILLFMQGIGLPVLHAQHRSADRIFTSEDKHLAEEKLHAFSDQSNLPVAELITRIGLTFLNTPYVGGTLENGMDEKLVINLRELDCTTFAENCLALARTVKLGKTDFDTFADEIEKIRYRHEKRNRYPSRLHYFSEWIQDNHQKGFINNQINVNGVKFDKAIHFMSTHPTSYPVLKEHPELVTIIAWQEKELTKAELYYFPKDQPDNLYKYLQQGDIVGLTSSIDGLDINHVGIIMVKDNQFYLLHASQSEKKVTVSQSPLSEFLKPASKNSGIMIARPVFK